MTFELGDLVRACGGWRVYKSLDLRADEVAVYEPRDPECPEADGLVQIGFRNRAGVRMYDLILMNGKTPTRIFDSATEFADITSVLFEYARDRYRFSAPGMATRKIVNPAKGHPLSRPTAKGFGFE
jgi:hypothetical protein